MCEDEGEPSPRPVMPAEEPAELGYEAPRDRLVRDPPISVLLATGIVVISGAGITLLIEGACFSLT
ncbi:MAG TPA: hypothetical protein VFE47_13065 [Tepidisphaeraceae bacterium]|jgi:hypothetical protein|nr:hypothetical protein [Tepidisphaeraceae bacterium]